MLNLLNSPHKITTQLGSIPGASIKNMSELTKLIAEFYANLAKFEVIAKRMEEREKSIQVIAADPAMRDLPFPDGIVPPPLPEGKTRWIYRGTFGLSIDHPCESRHVRYSIYGTDWRQAYNLSTHAHHIEAV